MKAIYYASTRMYYDGLYSFLFFFSSRRRHTRCGRDWSSDVCSSDLSRRERRNRRRAGRGSSHRGGSARRARTWFRGCRRGNSPLRARRRRSDLPRSRPPCRTRPCRRGSGCARSPAPRTPRARARRRAACRRTRTCMERPARAAGRRRAATAGGGGRHAGAPRAGRARSGSARWWPSSWSHIYLTRDSDGSRPVSVRLLVLVPVAAAISLALSAVVDAVALPLFLDTTGTILATALAGPGVGIATGVVTSAVNTLRNPTFWPFVVVQIIVALYAWAAARAGLFRSFRTAIPAGLGLGVIASVTSTPISYLVFGCTTTGGIALTTALGKALGLPPLGACFFGSFVSDFGDKAVTFALVTSVLHGLPRRTAARFPWALRAIGAA